MLKVKFQVKCMGRIQLWIERGSGCDVRDERNIEYQCYGEARVLSMVMVFGEEYGDDRITGRGQMRLLCEGNGQIELQDYGYCVAWLMSIVTGRGQVQWQVLRLRCGVADVNVDGEGSGPVARAKLFSKEYGNDRVTARVRIWLGFEGDGQIELQYYGNASETSLLLVKFHI
ncbi:Vinculin [Manis pentadactyla]|nr:Vinculin [Manis pentadactyla]